MSVPLVIHLLVVVACALTVSERYVEMEARSASWKSALTLVVQLLPVLLLLVRLLLRLQPVLRLVMIALRIIATIAALAVEADAQKNVIKWL